MDLGRERYVNLATFRRNGSEVRTPVWVAPDGERLVVWTNVNSFKVKRLRRDGRAMAPRRGSPPDPHRPGPTGV